MIKLAYCFIDLFISQNMLNIKHSVLLYYTDLQKEATVRDFLEVLALCHTVEVTGEVGGRMVYNAASPDEKALVEACHNYGVNFK